jgi:AcrR family transcriptional regulator
MPPKSTTAPARNIESEPSDATELRLIEAAGQVFAKVGFQAATVREICTRAGVNIASVNYYFGDKMGLYIAVLRESMSHEPGAAVQLGVNAGKKDAREGLRLLLRAMFSVVLADERRGWYMRIMAHELANPTPALDRVASEVIARNYTRLRGLIGKIIDRSDEDDLTRLCTHSIIGQILHYAHGRPMISRLWPSLAMTPETLQRIADHIATFSLAGMDAVAKGTSATKDERKRKI